MQSTIKQLWIDIDSLNYELLERGAQIGEKTSGIEHFQKTDRAAYLQSSLVGKLARMLIIEQHMIGVNFSREKNCA